MAGICPSIVVRFSAGGIDPDLRNRFVLLPCIACIARATSFLISSQVYPTVQRRRTAQFHLVTPFGARIFLCSGPGRSQLGFGVFPAIDLLPRASLFSNLHETLVRSLVARRHSSFLPLPNRGAQFSPSGVHLQL